MRLCKEKRWALACVLLTCLVAVLSRTVFFLGYIPTESMEPTLKKNSFILATRLYEDLNSGDIIVFERDGRLLVKRIAASSGEAVAQNGSVLVVPEGCYYVCGDNSDQSYDSRFWTDPFVRESSKIVLARDQSDEFQTKIHEIQYAFNAVCPINFEDTAAIPKGPAPHKV